MKSAKKPRKGPPALTPAQVAAITAFCPRCATRPKEHRPLRKGGK